MRFIMINILNFTKYSCANKGTQKQTTNLVKQAEGDSCDLQILPGLQISILAFNWEIRMF